MKYVDEPVKIEYGTKGWGRGEDVKYSHPSYGMARLSRLSGNFSELFGSEVDNSSAMCLTIGNASLTQDLGDNWYFKENTIVEAYLSPIQYSELISNPNTEGVPCTLRYVKGVGHIIYKPHATQVDYSLQKVKDLADGLQNNIKKSKERATEILSQKGGLKKADKEELMKLISSMDRKLSDGIPFYTKQVKDNAERMVAEAKTDAEALVTNIHNKIGSKILERPDIIQLLVEDKSGE